MYFYLSIIMSILCLVEGAIIFWLFRSRKKPQPDKTASQLLTQLLKGHAVIVTSVIDPDNLMVISPRDMS